MTFSPADWPRRWRLPGAAGAGDRAGLCGDVTFRLLSPINNRSQKTLGAGALPEQRHCEQNTSFTGSAVQAGRLVWARARKIPGGRLPGWEPSSRRPPTVTLLLTSTPFPLLVAGLEQDSGWSHLGLESQLCSSRDLTSEPQVHLHAWGQITTAHGAALGARREGGCS